MTRVLLDTSGYSALLRGHTGIQHALQEADEIFVNPIVLGELKAGFRRGKQLKKNEGELALFLESSRVGVLPLDEDTADRYAVILETLRAEGTPIPTNDLWIASTGMQHGLRVLTTDGHFQSVPQILVKFFGP